MRPSRQLLVCFIGGAISIVILRALIPSLWGAIVAALLAGGVILWLGMHYWKLKRDVNRAGDDLYYLGLLFTLVSLIYALVRLFIIDTAGDLEQRTNELIGNFGIALFSTVAGILGRILMQSMADGRDAEPPPTPSPDEVLAAHGKALEELRLQIRRATDAFRHFTRVTTEQAAENKLFVRDEVERSIERMTEAAGAALQDTQAAWQQSIEDIRAANLEMAGQLNQELTSATKHSTTAWRDLTQRAEAASSTTRRSLDDLVKEMSGMLETMAALNQALAPLPTNLASATDNIRGLGGTAVAAAKELESRATDIANGYDTLTKGVQQHQEKSLQLYETALQSTKTKHDELANELNVFIGAIQRLTAEGASQSKRSPHNGKMARRMAGAPPPQSSIRRLLPSRKSKRSAPASRR